MNIQLNEYFHVQCMIYTHIYTCHGAIFRRDAQEVPDAIQRIDMLMPSAARASHTGYRATTIGGAGFRNRYHSRS